MVGGGIRVEAQIRPVAKIAVAPDGNGVRCAGGRLCASGAGKGFEVEEVDLVNGEGVVGGENGDGVVAEFVVVVSGEVGEGCECAGRCEGRVVGEDGHVVDGGLEGWSRQSMGWRGGYLGEGGKDSTSISAADAW